jgi:galactose mutarotase-like enzyme
MNTTNELNLAVGDTHVTIAPHRGAIVTSFRVDDRELLYLDQATFNDRSKNVRGGIPILFPSPGKLENDSWTRAGRSGQLKQHGFARNAAWRVVDEGPSHATLGFDATPETLQSFPWRFAARLTYTVAPNSLCIDFQIENADDSAMPFAFGLHPYFVVTDKAKARVPTLATHAFNNVTKQVEPFTEFDFTQDEVDLHLLDHGSRRARLEIDDGSAVIIDASAEFVRWIVWTVGGKEYICVEPWTASGNALNSGDDLLELAPGERRGLRTQISLEAIQAIDDRDP